MNDLDKETMNYIDYPQLYRVADSLSVKYQKKHFGLLAAYLLLLIVSAIIPMCGNCVLANSISLGLFLLSAALYAISQISNPLNLWYNGRAVAESVKSMTWKWMMMADPYSCKTQGTASLDLQKDLQNFLKQNNVLFKNYQEDDGNSYSISNKMKEIRNAAAIVKMKFYNKNRVQEQLNWYRDKSKILHRRNIVMSRIIGGCYVIMTILMIVSIVKPNKFLPIEIIAVVITAFISWSEAKKYKELSCAYSLAVNEMSIINKDQLESQVSEAEVAEFVLKCENAFSHEHTLWNIHK